MSPENGGIFSSTHNFRDDLLEIVDKFEYDDGSEEDGTDTFQREPYCVLVKVKKDEIPGKHVMLEGVILVNQWTFVITKEGILFFSSFFTAQKQSIEVFSKLFVLKLNLTGIRRPKDVVTTSF